nr:F-box protein At4g22390-like [Quercus suber]
MGKGASSFPLHGKTNPGFYGELKPIPKFTENIYAQVALFLEGMEACNDIYLLSPSIRTFKRLPDTCLTQLSNVALGFGYDSLNNDYKVVRISLTRAEPMLPPEAEEYSLSSDSWKRIGVGFSWRPNDYRSSFNFNNYLTFPFVSGHVHWLIELVKEGNGHDGRYTDMILSFDVNSEEFNVLPLSLPDEGSCMMKCLMSFKEKLALFKFDIRLSFSIGNIWVMTEYGVFDSWNKLYVVPVQSFFNINGLTKYGLLLIRNMPSLVSTNSELERKPKSVLIDPETLHEKEISNQVDCLLHVADYVENLALLDQANVVSYKEDSAILYKK